MTAPKTRKGSPMTDDSALRPEAVSVDRTADNEPRLRLRLKGHTESVEVILDIEESLNLLADLANNVRHATTQAIVSSHLPDCPQCLNTRMVDVPRNNRSWAEHCSCTHPKETVESSEAALRRRFPWRRPRVGGGVR